MSDVPDQVSLPEPSSAEEVRALMNTQMESMMAVMQQVEGVVNAGISKLDDRVRLMSEQVEGLKKRYEMKPK